MTPVVFLPGMMCDARLFAPQVAALLSRCDVMVARITEANSVKALAAVLLANAPPRFALAGLSMGGIVAMEVLRQAPDRVDRIALLDTNPLAEAEAVKERRFPQMEAVKQGDLARIMRDELKPKYLYDGPSRQDVLDLCMEMALALGPDVFLRQSEALMTRPDQSDTLRQSDLPALILCGRHDALCPISSHELMAELMPQARFEIIEEAGHLPTLEQPDATTKALINWLEA